MILGLCYSEQQLLLSETEGITTHKEANLFLLFRFVKQHYKTLDCIIVYEFVGFENDYHYFLFILLFLKSKKTALNLESIPVKSSLAVVGNKSIDVIIPNWSQTVFICCFARFSATNTLAS
jgi:hypothetical protein